MGALDDPRTEGRLLLLAADFITVALLTAGSALSFLSAYGLAADLGAVMAFCMTASAVSAAVHSLSRPWWSAVLAGGIGLCFWPAWEEVSQTVGWLGWKMGVLTVLTGLPPSVPEEEAFLPAFLLLCAVLAWTMGWMAVRVRQWYLAALLSVTLVLPAIQGGVLPAWGAMLAVFTGWGAMLLTALYGRKDPGGLGRAQLLSLAGMGALILTLVIALPMEGYLRPQWATEARNRLVRGITAQLERFLDMEEFSGGILSDLGLDLSLPEEGGEGAQTGGSAAQAFGGGPSRREDLLTLGPRRYQYRQIMTAETNDPDAPGETLYLLGGTLNTYTGESWENEEFSGQPAYFPAMTAPEAAAYAMTIRYTSLGGTWYYPYRLVDGGTPDESGRLSGVADLALEADLQTDGLPDRDRRYIIIYRPGGPEDGFSGLPGNWQQVESDYRRARAFEERYLDVPDAVRQTLEALLSRGRWEMVIASLEEELPSLEGDARVEREETLRQLREMMDSRPTLEDLGGMVEITDDMDFRERYEASVTAASRTAELLSAWAVYDLNAPAMEPGEDFVEHFLTEGRGYCVHFATAGAMLLRMQGIPARYAAGYVAELNSQGYSRVLDSDAHAWVEIYLDGYGWYPVEMTPGYGGGESGVELAGAPEEESPDQSPEPEEPPEEEKAPEELPEEEVPEEDVPEAAGIPWEILGRIALPPAALGGAYALALLLRRRQRESGDTNRSALWAYRRYRRALRLGGAEDETLEELGRKARFSQHTLTAEERERAWQCLEGAAETAKRRQKRWMRWVVTVLRPWI